MREAEKQYRLKHLTDTQRVRLNVFLSQGGNVETFLEREIQREALLDLKSRVRKRIETMLEGTTQKKLEEFLTDLVFSFQEQAIKSDKILEKTEIELDDFSKRRNAMMLKLEKGTDKTLELQKTINAVRELIHLFTEARKDEVKAKKKYEIAFEETKKEHEKLVKATLRHNEEILEFNRKVRAFNKKQGMKG